jgi:hypothetical protein
MERIGLPFESQGIFVTNVVSHLFILPTLRQLLQRRWTFEAIVTLFSITTSFTYHLAQVLQAKLFLDELQWHWLDNVGAISSFGVWLTYMGCIRDPFVDQYVKYATVLIAVFIQVPHPWDPRFTFGPIAAFFLIPITTFCIRFATCPGSCGTRVQAALSVYTGREALIGALLLVVALFFFSLGLDEKSDPYRAFHGLWHLVGGLSSLHLWRIVRQPTAAETATALGRVVLVPLVPAVVATAVSSEHENV